MGYILAFVILMIIIYSLIWFPKNDTRVLYSLYFLMLLMAGFSYGLQDYGMYEKFYDNSLLFEFVNLFDYTEAIRSDYSRDFGYTILSLLFNYIGADFYIYRFFLYFVGLLIITYYSKKISENAVSVLGLYLLYPFIMDNIQIRNYMVEIVLFVGFYYYCKKTNATLKWLFFIFIGVSFHSSAIAYILFPLFDKLLDSKFKFISMFFVLVGICMPLYAGWVQDNWMVVGMLLRDSDTSFSHYAFYTEKDVIRKHLTCYTFMVIAYFVSVVLCNISREKYIIKPENNILILYIEKVRIFLMYNFCFMPLYPLFSDLAIRFPRNCLLMLFVCISLIIAKSNTLYRCMWFGIGAIMALFMGRLDLYAPVLIDTVSIFMSRNYLFEFIGV